MVWEMYHCWAGHGLYNSKESVKEGSIKLEQQLLHVTFFQHLSIVNVANRTSVSCYVGYYTVVMQKINCIVIFAVIGKSVYITFQQQHNAKLCEALNKRYSNTYKT